MFKRFLAFVACTFSDCKADGLRPYVVDGLHVEGWLQCERCGAFHHKGGDQ